MFNFDERISLYSAEETASGNSFRDKTTYTLELSCWAAIDNPASSLKGSDVQNLVYDYRIVVRRRDQIKNNWKIIWGTKTLYIDAINSDKNFTYLDCSAKEE